jgi:hypothetical protein
MSSYPELQSQTAEQPKLYSLKNILLSTQFSFLFTMTVYDSDTDTIIAESPTDAEGPIVMAFTERKDGSTPEGSQTEGRKDIASPNKAPLPILLCESSYLWR